MKRLFVIILVFTIQFINAQDQDLQKAKRYFDRTYYTEAIPLYEAIITENRTVEVIKNLADCYYYTNDLKNAQKYYRALVKNYNKNLSEEYYFRYAQTLKANGNYDEANTVLKEYFAGLSDTNALNNFEKELKELDNVSAIGKRFEIKNLGINTVHSEFGAVKKDDFLVYAAVKKKAGMFDKVYKWNNESYLNLVSIPLKNVYSADSIVNYFAKELNTSMHESNAVFTKDGKTIYFTRNNYKKGRRGKNKEKISNLQIFKAEFVNNKWTNAKALPINSADYSIEHPALSEDEKTLYFASDMPGTLGSFDIYAVDINGGLFGTPVNLGPNVNTSKKEQFPFISKDGKLYFSSNGHAGYGLLDIFVSENNGNQFAKAQNVGAPVNSGQDDFAFTIDTETQQGYFSSNRPGGKGSDDIYFLKETKPLVIEDCMQYLAGTITDIDSKLPLENAVVKLYDAEKNQIQSVTTTVDGQFTLTVPCEKGYSIIASKENYTTETKSFLLNKERKRTNDASLSLKSIEVIKQEEQIALEQKKKEELQAAEQKKKDDLIALEEKKKEEKAALVKKKEQELKDKEVAAVQKKEKIEKIIAAEKDVVKVKDKLVIKTDPIYFDYNLWYIRRDSKPILKRVIELMKKYPEMVVEIGSHTDSRGNKRFNLDLSEKRALSTKEYLIDLGIDENRIIAKGYGSSQPKVKCETDKACTEEQHELNRRSEFVIKNL